MFCCKSIVADVLSRAKTAQVMCIEGGRAEKKRQVVAQTGGGGTGEERGEGEKWRGDNGRSWKCEPSLSHAGSKVEQRKQLTRACRGGGKFVNTPTHLWCIAIGIGLRSPRAISFITANRGPHAQYCTCTVLSRPTLDVSARPRHWQSARVHFGQSLSLSIYLFKYESFLFLSNLCPYWSFSHVIVKQMGRVFMAANKSSVLENKCNATAYHLLLQQPSYWVFF